VIALLSTLAWAVRPDVAVVISDDLSQYNGPVPSFTDAVGVPVQVVNLYGRRSTAEAEAEALRQAAPEVVFALGTKAAWAIKNEMPNTPLIYAAVYDPGRYGIEGTQVTGVHFKVPPVTYLSEMNAYFPDVRKVGVIRSTRMPAEDEERMRDAAKEVGLGLDIVKVDKPRDFRKAFNRMADENDAIWISPDVSILTSSGFRAAVEEMKRRKKPLLGDTANMVTSGAAFAVTPRAEGVGEQAAQMAVRILDGAAPAIMPIADPEQLSTTLNKGLLDQAGIAYETLMVDFADTVLE
jgi:putative ABC transport system substrate-binding protein